MANRAYASVWCRDFRPPAMPGLLENFLATAPLSASWRGFTSLVVRAVHSSETPLLEQDMRSLLPSSGEIAEMAAPHLDVDTAVEVEAFWDLWVYDAGAAGWQHKPQKLLILCHGEEYDDGAAAAAGHFQVDAGFEHFFTGHAGLLGFNGHAPSSPEHPAEAEFLARMSRPENLRAYLEKTRANIRTLQDWMRQVESQLPVEHYRLWSEGETNFEARLDEILAVR